jgi:nicotinamidase-related amidase
MLTENPELNLDPGTAALLVVDVQRALFTRPTPIFQAEKLLQNLNQLIALWHQEGSVVIYVQHSNKTLLVKDTPDWELHPDLERIDAGILVHKLHGNAFEKTGLKSVLDSRGIGTVVVTGLVTHGCVRATCIGARELGYRVILVEDGHSNCSKGAEKIIEEWNKKLSQEHVELIPADSIVSSVGGRRRQGSGAV